MASLKTRMQLADGVYTTFLSVVIVPIIVRFLKRLIDGTSEVLHVEIVPTGETVSFGGQRKPTDKRFDRVPVTLSLLRPAHFCWMMLLDEKLGLGEAYIAGDYRATPGVMQLLRLLIRAKHEKKALRSSSGRSSSSSLFSALSSAALSTLRWAAACYNYIRHRARDNTVTTSRQNNAEHYDLGNDMFRMFLDPTLTYSSGIFEDDPDQAVPSPLNFDRLEEAQWRKYDALLDRLNLTEDDHVLEIGCGWGSCAIRGVQRFGCKWTGITASSEHLDLARQRVAEAGFADRVDLQLLDFRLVTGSYTAIISIEMIEHVGEAFLPDYFRTIHDRLVPGGRCALQAILCPDAYYDRYKSSSDFIKKHIFPGGHLPSFGAINRSLPCGKDGKEMLELTVEAEIPHHYALTLDYWYTAWLSRESEILSLGYSPAFHRKWQFYFALCSSLFAYDHINDAQFTLRRRIEA